MWNSNISSAVLLSDYSCKFETGDGVGGTEQNIGHQPTPQACIDACATKKQTDPDINGVTIKTSAVGSCYCEKKMKKSNGNPSWKTCKLVYHDSKNDFFLKILFHIYLALFSFQIWRKKYEYNIKIIRQKWLNVNQAKLHK